MVASPIRELGADMPLKVIPHSTIDERPVLDSISAQQLPNRSADERAVPSRYRRRKDFRTLKS